MAVAVVVVVTGDNGGGGDGSGVYSSLLECSGGVKGNQGLGLVTGERGGGGGGSLRAITKPVFALFSADRRSVET